MLGVLAADSRDEEQGAQKSTAFEMWLAPASKRRDSVPVDGIPV